MDNSFKNIIDSAESVLILLPTHPYFDQVAAGLSLFLATRSTKNVSIACPNPMLVEFNRLIGVNKITQELGNKNLVIRFSDYQATSIERVSYDIENGEFRLSVIPKSGNNPPIKEQVNLSYSGVSADCVILVGGTNETHFPAISSKDLAGAKVMHVGVKPLSLPEGVEVLSFARQSSTVAELAYDILKEGGYDIDPDIATNLLMGIEAGTNNFSSNYVTADTFAAASALMKMGGKRQTGEVRRSFPQGAIPQAEEPRAEEVEKKEEPPKEWLGPKIYKGTNIS
jgi:hypothetical protein